MIPPMPIVPSPPILLLCLTLLLVLAFTLTTRARSRHQHGQGMPHDVESPPSDHKSPESAPPPLSQSPPRLPSPSPPLQTPPRLPSPPLPTSAPALISLSNYADLPPPLRTTPSPPRHGPPYTSADLIAASCHRDPGGSPPPFPLPPPQYRIHVTKTVQVFPFTLEPGVDGDGEVDVVGDVNRTIHVDGARAGDEGTGNAHGYRHRHYRKRRTLVFEAMPLSEPAAGLASELVSGSIASEPESIPQVGFGRSGDGSGDGFREEGDDGNDVNAKDKEDDGAAAAEPEEAEGSGSPHSPQPVHASRGAVTIPEADLWARMRGVEIDFM